MFGDLTVPLVHHVGAEPGLGEQRDQFAGAGGVDGVVFDRTGQHLRRVSDSCGAAPGALARAASMAA